MFSFKTLSLLTYFLQVETLLICSSLSLSLSLFLTYFWLVESLLVQPLPLEQVELTMQHIFGPVLDLCCHVDDLTDLPVVIQNQLFTGCYLSLLGYQLLTLCKPYKREIYLFMCRNMYINHLHIAN